MLDFDQIKNIPKGQPMAIFGDTNFPVGRIGRPKKIRKEFEILSQKFKVLLKLIGNLV